MADLCTIAEVKAHGGIDAANDTALTALVVRVSRAMESFVGRTIALATITDELHRTSGLYNVIVLDERAESITTVTENEASATDSSLYELVGERRLLRKSGTSIVAWPAAAVRVTYQAGWTTVPADWVHYAVKQCRQEWDQYDAAQASGRFGELSRSGSQGETATFVGPSWLPDVEAFLKHERRFF